MDDTSSSSATPGRRRSGTRGFLFADLRGYTAFLERHGADTSATLLDRYRRLVRAAVEAHDGAEIRTEGDSFYVVFPDASGAVACGLAIVKAAADATTEDPSTPIRVGIGVHAGETVETSEGYVGAAVNLAARLCAAARPGEVLVSDTVRALTSGITTVKYDSRGRMRFKGIGEAVGTYRAVDDGTVALAPPRRRWPVVLAAAAGLSLAIVAAAVIGGALIREGLGRQLPSASAASTNATMSGAPSSVAPTEPATVTSVELEEARLMELVDERFHPTCSPTPEGDIPRYHETRNDTHGPRSWPLMIRAGIVCEPFGIGVPDTIGIWRLSSTSTISSGVNETDAIFNLAGQRGAAPGSCDDGAPASEPWSAGPISGYRLCHLDGGRAVLYWTYDAYGILARATRDDGDLEALLDWWRNDARFRQP